MRHSSSRIAADRHANGMSRSTMETVDDTKLMQEVAINLFSEEKQQGIERFVQYGFTAVPQPPTGSGKLRRAAEAMFSFLGGNRSHGIAMMVGDRRYRLYKLANGEVALHDDQGQQVHFRRDGIWASVPQSKQIKMQVMDDDTMPQDTSGGGSGQAQKMGQVQQAGRGAVVNIVLDKNQFTINHPNGTVNINAQTINLTASQKINETAGTSLNLQGGSGAVGGVFTVGRTFLGVDSKDEIVFPIVPDVSLAPSKQTKVKIA